jgi:hypothetical protein
MIVEIDILHLLGIIGAGAVAVYATYKWKLHQIRILFDRLDDATKDDTVTKEEFDDIWKALQACFKRQPKS